MAPSGDKGKSHDSSEEGKKDEDKEENDAANSDPVDEPNKGDNADSPSGDKGKSHDSSEEGKKGDGNGLDIKCAAGDLCKLQGAPILEPQHKCMNCRNQMHGGICGVQWSDRRVDQIDISIGKYPPVPFFLHTFGFPISHFLVFVRLLILQNLCLRKARNYGTHQLHSCVSSVMRDYRLKQKRLMTPRKLRKNEKKKKKKKKKKKNTPKKKKKKKKKKKS